MGRRRGTGAGVEIREYASGRRAIRIHFSYRGVECRETLKGLKPTAANCRFAERLIATIQHEITTGTFDYLARFPQSKKARLFARGSPAMTLDLIEEDYRAHMKALQGIRYQPATVKAYLQPLDAWVLPKFGKLALREIRPPVIARELGNLAKAGRSPKTISAYKTALNKILDYCVEQEYIEHNPALLVQAGRAAGVKDRERKIDPLDQDEVDQVLAAADDDFARYLACAFYSGLRTSELYGLKWEDVDWNRKSVTVQRAVVHGKVKVPKTASGVREVLLRGLAWEALQGQRAASELRGEFIWLNPTTGQPFRRYKETAGRWKRTLRRAGVRYRNQYQTRHTYASNHLSQGENEYFIAQQLGHANVQQVRKVYGRWIEQSREGQHQWVSGFGKKNGAG